MRTWNQFIWSIREAIRDASFRQNAVKMCTGSDTEIRTQQENRVRIVRKLLIEFDCRRQIRAHHHHRRHRRHHRRWHAVYTFSINEISIIVGMKGMERDHTCIRIRYCHPFHCVGQYVRSDDTFVQYLVSIFYINKIAGAARSSRLISASIHRYICKCTAYSARVVRDRMSVSACASNELHRVHFFRSTS